MFALSLLNQVSSLELANFVY